MSKTIYHSLLENGKPILSHINKLKGELEDTELTIDTAVGLFPSDDGRINVRLYSKLLNGSFNDSLLMNYQVTDKQIQHEPHNPLIEDSITEIFKSEIDKTDVVLYNDRRVFQEIEKRLSNEGYAFKEI
ncbi:MAG: hypothetical protein AABY14_01325 [Nanoarchaeota archaeon]